MSVVVADDVAQQLARRGPVVAFESTVFSTLGLPHPHNGEALRRAHDIVREAGAVPAMTAVLDGVARIGVGEQEWERILSASAKVAERDISTAIGLGLAVGVTTVSASVALAAAAGIEVFATGGIGGVHVGAAQTGDISADLGALARHPVVTVSAGAKSFLDLGRTLEHLEMLSVPVVGWGTNRLPAFTALDGGHELPVIVESAEQAAAVARARFNPALGQPGGLLVAVAPPTPLDPEVAAQANRDAEAAADAAGVTGAARTPFVLERVAAVTGGASVAANIDLVANNARVAAEIAVALSEAE